MKQRTATFRLTSTSSNFARADHTKTLCLVKCANLLLRLAKRHTVLQLP